MKAGASKALGATIVFLIIFGLVSIPTIVVLHKGHTLPLNTLPLNTTSSQPLPDRVGYTSGPNTRGTMNLIWSCLTTIFACVYAAMHFSVPKTNHTTLRRMWTKVGWVTLGLVAPEFMVVKAAEEWLLARKLTKEMRSGSGRVGGSEVVENEQTGWNDEKGSVSGSPNPSGPSKEAPEWTTAHSFFAIMGGFSDRNGKLLTPSDLTFLASSSPPFSSSFTASVLPNLPTYLLDITDKSKADPIVKTFACIQVTWFLANIIARASLKMPVSQLELTTCGYIPGTLMTYAMWWSKPYSVGQRIMLPVDSPRGGSGEGEEEREEDKITLGQAADPTWQSASIMSLGSLIFGACHLIAWNDLFINTHGQPLWRISSLLITILPPLTAPFILFGQSYPKYNWLASANTFVCFLVYCGARVALGVLLVMSFWSLPRGVYDETDWATFLPTIR